MRRQLATGDIVGKENCEAAQIDGGDDQTPSTLTGEGSAYSPQEACEGTWGGRGRRRSDTGSFPLRPFSRAAGKRVSIRQTPPDKKDGTAPPAHCRDA